MDHFLKIFKFLYTISGVRYFFRKYILYNKLILTFLTKINSLRWNKIRLYLIIWPPAIDLVEEIKNDLNKLCEIIHSNQFKIDKTYFKKFITELYSIDNASSRKISGKIDRLIKGSNQMEMILVEIKKPSMIANDFFNYVRCKQISCIKSKIRTKYKSKVNAYVYDVIIHSTEADYQNKSVEGLVRKYSLDGFDKEN